MFDTPILFLVFNRPDITTIVFEQLRLLKPSRLYIAADGPRKNNLEDKNKCEAVKEIFNLIDWNCKIVKLFRDTNLGCKVAVSEAITWFFEQVEEGIILEDDCLPNQSFFYFCEELLEKYRFDSRIMQICGSNYMQEFNQASDSYFFSNYGPIWGWATWRRFWNLYDANIRSWTIAKQLGLHYSISQSHEEAELRYNLFEKLYNNEIDTWDFQVVYARMLNAGLAIIPAKNLISNIGFGNDATHTKNPDERSKMENFTLDRPLRHPFFVVRNYQFDQQYTKKFILPHPSPIILLEESSLQKIKKYFLQLFK